MQDEVGFAGPHGPWSIVSVTTFQSLGFSFGSGISAHTSQS